MTRTRAWAHYFDTGDRDPLIRSYWDSIETIARQQFHPRFTEDFVQLGLIGLLKAIKRIDPARVKSVDAWVWLNVRGEMFAHARKFQIVDEGVLGESMMRDYMDERLDEVRFKDWLRGLPDREAVILWLIYNDGYKRTEIARWMGISSMRVGQLEKQALARLVP